MQEVGRVTGKRRVAYYKRKYQMEFPLTGKIKIFTYEPPKI